MNITEGGACQEIQILKTVLVATIYHELAASRCRADIATSGWGGLVIARFRRRAKGSEEQCGLTVYAMEFPELGSAAIQTNDAATFSPPFSAFGPPESLLE